MKKTVFLVLGCMLGVLSMQAEVLEETQSIASIDLANRAAVQDATHFLNEDLDAEELLKLSMRKKSSKSFVLFQADLTKCRIAIEDRDAIANNGADFSTAFGGDDFTCRVLDKGGIEISPANGSSFTVSVPPVPLPGPVPGGLIDHVKFLAYSLVRDLPTPSHQMLCSTWVGSAEQLHVNNNPFGQLAPHPQSDPRLACVSFASLAPDLLATFDWIVTNKVIYVLVERLPLGDGDYAAYTYLIPVAHRKTCNKSPLKDVHTFQTCFHSNGKTVTWILDGKPVFRITQVGHRLNEKNALIYRKGKFRPLKDPTRFQVADHGGTNRDLTITQVQTGLALFTLLDFFPPATHLNVTREQRINSGFYEGLVRLESSLIRPGTGGFFYNNPLQGGAATFFQNGTIFDPVTKQFLPTIPSTFRIFGQGAKLRLFEYRLSIDEKIK